MHLFSVLWLIAWPQAGRANENPMGFTYTRSHIVVMRAHVDKPQQPVMPWQTGDTQHAGLAFDVELRDAASFYKQSGWFNLSSPADRQGVLIVFDKPLARPVSRSRHYAPLDILFINQEGKISQIAPNIILNELDRDIIPDAPVRAFLLLKGGSCKDLSILPGDEVQHKIFIKPPLVIGSPEEKISAPAPAP